MRRIAHSRYDEHVVVRIGVVVQNARGGGCCEGSADDRCPGAVARQWRTVDCDQRRRTEVRRPVVDAPTDGPLRVAAARGISSGVLVTDFAEQRLISGDRDVAGQRESLGAVIPVDRDEAAVQRATLLAVDGELIANDRIAASFVIFIATLVRLAFAVSVITGAVVRSVTADPP